MAQWFSVLCSFKSDFLPQAVHNLSHSQLLVLFLLTVQNFSIFGCKEYNQSDFGVDHLVMSMCSLLLCCWKRVFAMISVFSLQNCQTLTVFVLYSKAKFTCYSRYLFTTYFCISVPYNEKDIFFACQFQKVLQIFLELFNFSFFSITGWGIGLDYRDIEWFALETNRDHHVIFETTSKCCISDSFVDYDGYSISLRDSWPQQQTYWSSELNSPITVYFSSLIPRSDRQSA